MASEWENRFFERVDDLLAGFKEVRLNDARSAELIQDIFEVSRTASNIKIRSQAETFKQAVFMNSSMYLLLGIIVFVAPMFSELIGDTSIIKITTALLFVVGTCFGLVQTFPILAAANSAADTIVQLEARLLETIRSANASEAEAHVRFEKIEMRQVVFRYTDKFSDAVFQVGPIDFNLHSGEVVFITGGNGSGKSTLLKLLAGLYAPDSGVITLDGLDIDNATRGGYRSLMTAIFSDYHLFRRLYGIPAASAAEIDPLLGRFRLLDKTHLKDDEFSTLDLSGGQRKRLALIVGLLEKRPVLLLDEWTADQDPEYRREFYREFLPALIQAGTTVVAVTHDDRYLQELDYPIRQLRMDNGKFI